MSGQIEDGELPEEGEIMEEEEDEESIPTTPSTNTASSAAPILPPSSSKNMPKENILPSKKNFALVPGGNATPSSSAKTSKYRDYDGKPARHVESTQELAMSSWVSGLQRRNRQTPTTTGSCPGTTELPNTTSTPPTSSITADAARSDAISPATKSEPVSSTMPIADFATGNTVDSKMKVETMDHDFRRLSSAEGEILDDGEVEEGEEKSEAATKSSVKNENFDAYGEDNDYRQHNNFSEDRRRRHSDGYSDDFPPFSKRAKAADAFGISSTQQSSGGDGEEDENSPTSSTPPFGEGGGNFATPNNYRGGNFHHNGRTPLGFMNASGGMMSRVAPPRWAGHTICKFFREGYCRDGDNCAFSHNAADSNRRPELCKFYSQGYCKRGMMCLHMHGEYPCKAFHKGDCENEECQYSHRPLDDFTRPIFDQMMQDEELTSHISIPAHPLRRKVLIPQGPETPESGEQQNLPTSGTLPSALRTAQPPHRAIEEKSMAATGTYGFFNPITPSSTAHSTTIPPPSAFAAGASGPTGYGHGGQGGASVGHSPGHGGGLTTPQHPGGGYGPPSGAASGPYPQGPPPHQGGIPPTGGILAASGFSSSPSSFHPPGRPSLQQPAGVSHHGFYNPPNRIANLPPPTLLTAPPPLASNPKAATSQLSSTLLFSSSPSSASKITTPASSLFNTPSTSADVINPPSSSLAPQQTSSSSATEMFSGAPFLSSLPASTASSAIFSTSFTTKSSDEPRKSLGIFSGGFFESSVTSSSGAGFNKSSIGAGSGGAGFHNIGMDMGGMGMGLGGGGSGEVFNISAMLEKITQQATTTSQTPTTTSLSSIMANATRDGGRNALNCMEDESPASPPSLFSDSMDISKTKMIPVIREWKLHKVDVDPPADITFDLKLIGQISSGAYRNDPRLKKLAEKQFDLVTKTLEKQSNAVTGGSGIAVKQEPVEFKTPIFSVAGTSTPSSSNKASSAENLVTARPSDPRMKLADPRKKAAVPPNAFAATTSQSFSVGGGVVVKQEPSSGYGGLSTASGGFSVPNFEDVKSSSMASSAFGTAAANTNIPSSVGVSQASQNLPDDIFQSMVQQQLNLLQQEHGVGPDAAVISGSDDVDHRASFPPPPIISGPKGGGKPLSGPSAHHGGGVPFGGSHYYYGGGKGVAGANWNASAQSMCGRLPTIGADPRTGGAVDANNISSGGFGNKASYSATALDDSNGGARVSSTSNFDGGFDASDDAFEGESRSAARDSRFGGSVRGGGFHNGRGGMRYANNNIIKSNNNGYDESNRGSSPSQRWEHQGGGNSSPGNGGGGRFVTGGPAAKNAGSRNFFQNKTDHHHNTNQQQQEGGASSTDSSTKMSPPSVASSAAAAPPPAPLSLREKRKNNEYESPLARMSTKY